MKSFCAGEGGQQKRIELLPLRGEPEWWASAMTNLLVGSGHEDVGALGRVRHRRPSAENEAASRRAVLSQRALHAQCAASRFVLWGRPAHTPRPTGACERRGMDAPLAPSAADDGAVELKKKYDGMVGANDPKTRWQDMCVDRLDAIPWDCVRAWARDPIVVRDIAYHRSRRSLRPEPV